MDGLVTLCALIFPAVSSLSLNNNLDGLLACPGQKVRFLCLVNSPQLIWSSNEYIGEPSMRIEFSYIDRVNDTKMVMQAVARLLSVNGMNVTSSELIITTSQAFPTASVKCDDGIQNVTNDFTVPSPPGIPRNVKVITISPLSSDCVVFLQWDIPDNVPASFLSHYSLDFDTKIRMIHPSSTVAVLTLENCDLNATIGIRAVDICDREGARTNKNLEDIFLAINIVTPSQDQSSTSFPGNDNSDKIIYILVVAVEGGIILILIISLTTVMILCFKSKVVHMDTHQ